VLNVALLGENFQSYLPATKTRVLKWGV